MKPVKTSGESAFELTMVYGQRTTFPFAYDCMGDIRWYMSGEFTSGIYMLSNSRMIVASNEAFMPSQDKPQTTNLYEMDYLGRAYTMYYVAGGNHHEVIEKEPDGNLLVLTSSLEGHIEDKIQEIDRQTGEVINELIMEDIFSGKYEDRVDWTHLNTVSYQPETDTIVISPRNLESVVKLNWTNKWKSSGFSAIRNSGRIQNMRNMCFSRKGILFISSSSILPTAGNRSGWR